MIDTGVTSAMFKFALLMALPAIAISLMLLLAMRQRRNWARWTFAVWAGYSACMTAFGVVLDWHRLPLSVASGVLGAGLSLAAVALLFQRRSTSWFKPRAGV